MTERRGSGRNIVFWQMKCQREGCGHPRVRHLTEPKPQCCALVYPTGVHADGTTNFRPGRCDCPGFQEVTE